MHEVSTLDDTRALLGEGPLWDPDRGHVLWVDIERRMVHDLDLARGAVSRVEVPEAVTALGLTDQPGSYIASLERDVAIVDSGMRVLHRFGNPEPDRTGNRFNDGKVGPDGAWWTGTMHGEGSARTGALYRLEASGAWQRIDDDIAITNGPCFSPDGGWMYHNDTPNQVVHRFAIRGDGSVGPREVFATIEGAAHPDGMTTDAEGTVYVCLWGGWGIARFRPDGTSLDPIRLPVAQVTCCTFAGRDLDTLVVTSATTGLTSAQRADQPAAGTLLAVRPHRATHGSPGQRFAMP